MGGKDQVQMGTKKRFWVRELICIFIVVVVTQLYTINKNYTVHLKLVDFIVVNNALIEKEEKSYPSFEPRFTPPIFLLFFLLEAIFYITELPELFFCKS